MVRREAVREVRQREAPSVRLWLLELQAEREAVDSGPWLGLFGAEAVACRARGAGRGATQGGGWRGAGVRGWGRSEEHTSELQSRFDLVCRLLLEKKK